MFITLFEHKPTAKPWPRFAIFPEPKSCQSRLYIFESVLGEKNSRVTMTEMPLQENGRKEKQNREEVSYSWRDKVAD